LNTNLNSHAGVGPKSLSRFFVQSHLSAPFTGKDENRHFEYNRGHEQLDKGAAKDVPTTQRVEVAL
jgi:hypothetical protein